MRDSTSIVQEARQRVWERFEYFGFTSEDLEILIKDCLVKMSMANVLNRYMSTRELALRLGVHGDTVRKYLREGQIKSIKIGGRYRVRELDLLNFIREREELHARLDDMAEDLKIIKLARSF